jgi:hypothetical protein
LCPSIGDFQVRLSRDSAGGLYYVLPSRATSGGTNILLRWRLIGGNIVMPLTALIA